MTRTLLVSVNNVLAMFGERTLTDTGTGLGGIAKTSLTNALYEFAQGGRWEIFRKFLTPSAWTLNVGTLPSNTYQIAGVYWYSSPDGNAASAYDYKRYPLDYIPPEAMRASNLVPYADTSNRAIVWTGSPTAPAIAVNPYPTSTLEKGKILVDYYEMPVLPAGDATTWTGIPDIYLNLLELLASVNLSTTHFQEANLSAMLNNRYQSMLKVMRLNQNNVPTKGTLSMYKHGRGRRLNASANY